MKKKLFKYIINIGSLTIEKLGQIGNIYSGMLAIYSFLLFCSGYGLIRFLNSVKTICSICVVFPYFLVRAFFNL